MAGIACLGLDAIKYAATRLTGGSTDAYRNWLEGVTDPNCLDWVKVSVMQPPAFVWVSDLLWCREHSIPK